MSDRRNSELHTGAAAFEGIDNSKWLPATYEVIEVLLVHLKRDFADFLGASHGAVAVEALKDRRDSIKKDVQTKLAAARKFYVGTTAEWNAERAAKSDSVLEGWIKASKLRLKCVCPACGNAAVMSGESQSRSPVRIDEDSSTIKREVRVLPNSLHCPFCKLDLSGYQEVREAGLAACGATGHFPTWNAPNFD